MNWASSAESSVFLASVLMCEISTQYSFREEVLQWLLVWVMLLDLFTCTHLDESKQRRPAVHQLSHQSQSPSCFVIRYILHILYIKRAFKINEQRTRMVA